MVMYPTEETRWEENSATASFPHAALITHCSAQLRAWSDFRLWTYFNVLLLPHLSLGADEPLRTDKGQLEVWCVYAANISLGQSVLNQTAALFRSPQREWDSSTRPYMLTSCDKLWAQSWCKRKEEEEKKQQLLNTSFVFLDKQSLSDL